MLCLLKISFSLHAYNLLHRVRVIINLAYDKKSQIYCYPIVQSCCLSYCFSQALPTTSRVNREKSLTIICASSPNKQKDNYQLKQMHLLLLAIVHLVDVRTVDSSIRKIVIFRAPPSDVMRIFVRWKIQRTMAFGFTLNSRATVSRFFFFFFFSGE